MLRKGPDSLRDFLRRVPEYRRPVGVRRVVPAVTARKVVQELAECDMAGDVEGSRSWRALLGNRQKLAIKVFKFAEDVRPGYVGTWTKQTRSVRPRKPFGKDTCLLNYEYDSEGDWEEEEEEGEDLEEEEDEEGEAMSEVDSEDGGWLVDDDEPVEGEGDESMELDDDIMFVGATGELAAVSEARRKKALEKKRSATKEGAKKRKLVGPLVPIVKGPLWEKELGQVESETLQPFRIQFLNGAPKLPAVGADRDADMEYRRRAHRARPIHVRPRDDQLDPWHRRPASPRDGARRPSFRPAGRVRVGFTGGRPVGAEPATAPQEGKVGRLPSRVDAQAHRDGRRDQARQTLARRRPQGRAPERAGQGDQGRHRKSARRLGRQGAGRCLEGQGRGQGPVCGMRPLVHLSLPRMQRR